MADIWELTPSREQVEGAAPPDLKTRWCVDGTEEEEQVHALVKFTVPRWLGKDPIVFYRLVPQGAGVWLVEVQYGAKVSEYQFDTTGGKQKITSARRSRYYNAVTSLTANAADGWDPDNPPSASPPSPFTSYKIIDHHKGVNCDQAGIPQGVEIPVPAYAFVIRRTFPAPLPDWYLDALEDLTGCVNTDIITVFIDGNTRTYQPGELRYDGATGGKRGDEDWSISLRFAAERNLAALTFGTGDDKIIEVVKKGFEFLWLDWVPIDNTSGGQAALVTRPQQVNVDEVFSTAALSPLFGLKAGPPAIVFGPLFPGGSSDPNDPGPTGPTGPDEGTGEAGDTDGDDAESGGGGGIDQVGDIIVN